MNIIGKLTGMRYSIADNVYTLELSTRIRPDGIEKLINKELKFDIKRFSPLRSLNANSLFHLMVDLIAKKINTSKIFVKNQMLCDYGQCDYENVIMLKSEIDVSEFEGLHLKASGRTIDVNGTEFAEYYEVRGSHTYSSREMSQLIDGTRREMDELGITMPISDAELQSILGKWELKKTE